MLGEELLGAKADPEVRAVFGGLKGFVEQRCEFGRTHAYRYMRYARGCSVYGTHEEAWELWQTIQGNRPAPTPETAKAHRTPFTEEDAEYVPRGSLPPSTKFTPPPA